MAEERVRRQQAEAARREEVMREQREYHLRLLWKLVHADEDWQLKTNRPNKAAAACTATPELVEAGNVAFDNGQYALALAHYQKALAQPLGNAVPLLSNCALIHLLVNEPNECIAISTQCQQQDPGFLPARLHRARAFRALGRPADAMRDLQEASFIASGHQLDICREQALLQLQIQDQALGNAPPSEAELFGALLIKKAMGGERLRKAFAEAVVQWHPELWATATPAVQREASEAVLRCWQAFATLNNWKRQKEWEHCLTRWKALHIAPHQRQPWLFKTPRVTELQTTALTEPLVRVVPLFSPASLTRPPTGIVADVDCATPAKAIEGIIRHLPALRKEWAWEPPKIESAEWNKLMNDMTKWKKELFPDL